MSPKKHGKHFDDSTLKSPLTVGRPRNEPGPEVHNSPVFKPADPLGFIPGGKSGKSGSKKGGY